MQNFLHIGGLRTEDFLCYVSTIPRFFKAFLMIAASTIDEMNLGAGFLRANKAVLFADVVDYVRLTEADEEGTVVRWVSFVDKLAARLAQTGKGRLVKRMGDGLLAEFGDAYDAVRAAKEIHSALADMNEPLDPGLWLEVRIGMDAGDVMHSADQDLYGQHVNTASRLASAARRGQTVVSAQIRDMLANAPNTDFEDMGELHLKNVARPIQAYLLRINGDGLRVLSRIAPADLLPTVAVLPLSSRTISDSTPVWSNLLTDDMVSALARSPDINVISRLSTASYRLNSLDMKDIQNKLGADFTLSGTFYQYGDTITLNLDLVELRTGLVVWSQSLECETSQLMQRNTFFSDLANMVLNALLNREMERALSAPLPTLQGYAVLFGAIALMNRLSRRDFETAGELLTTLIERVPNAPAALAWKARWHVLKVQQGWSEDLQTEARLALDYIERALEFDPQNTAALIAEGFVRNNLLHDLDTAIGLYNDALELTPNDATGRALRAALYTFRGEGEKAVKDAELALHLAPLDPNRFFLQSLAAGASLANNDNRRALELARNSFRLNRSHTSTLRVKAVAEWRLGLEAEARATVSRLFQRHPDFSIGWWTRNSPAARFEMGREFARSLKELGVPD
jgi:class 3 adenylate cyclase/tetratricopeptide (TPR) repeat protein